MTSQTTAILRCTTVITTMALRSTQLVTEMSTSNSSWEVKTADVQGWQTYHIHVSIVVESGSLNLLEPSGPVQGLVYTVITFFIFRCVANWS